MDSQIRLEERYTNLKKKNKALKKAYRELQRVYNAKTESYSKLLTQMLNLRKLVKGK